MEKTRQIIKRIIYKYIKSDYNGPLDFISIDIMTNIYRVSASRRELFEDDELFQISLHKKIGLEDLQHDSQPGEYRVFLNNLIESAVLDTRSPITAITFAEIAVKNIK